MRDVPDDVTIEMWRELQKVEVGLGAPRFQEEPVEMPQNLVEDGVDLHGSVLRPFLPFFVAYSESFQEDAFDDQFLGDVGSVVVHTHLGEEHADGLVAGEGEVWLF